MSLNWHGASDGLFMNCDLDEVSSDSLLMLCASRFQGPDGPAPTWAYSAGTQHRSFLSLRFVGVLLHGDNM